MKPDYPKHRKTRSVCRDARLLNIHLWNLADDEGRLQELPQWIIGEIFPTDEDVSTGTLREWLRELSSAGLITRYKVGGECYIQCHDFNTHQVISHPKQSELPPLSSAESASSSNPPVVPPERSSQEGKGMEGEKEGNGMSDASASDAPLSELLADLVASNDPNGKRPTVSLAWMQAEDRMLRLDNRSPQEAEKLIRWTQANDFWRGNVRSMPKFREKYGQLYLDAVKDSKRRSRSPALAGKQGTNPEEQRLKKALAERTAREEGQGVAA